MASPNISGIEKDNLSQGKAANIVNNSIIYHMLFLLYPGDSGKERNSYLYAVVLPRAAYKAKVRQDVLSRYRTDLGL